MTFHCNNFYKISTHLQLLTTLFQIFTYAKPNGFYRVSKVKHTKSSRPLHAEKKKSRTKSKQRLVKPGMWVFAKCPGIINRGADVKWKAADFKQRQKWMPQCVNSRDSERERDSEIMCNKESSVDIGQADLQTHWRSQPPSIASTDVWEIV